MRVWALLLCSTAALAAPVPKEVKKAPPMDGRWECVEMTFNGQDITANNPWVWDIDGTKLTISVRQADKSLVPLDPKTATTLTPPEKGEPGDLDYRRGGNGGVEYVLLGRARVEGDELVFVHADPNMSRATDMTNKAPYYYRFKRVPAK